MTNTELIQEINRYYSENFDYISSDQPTLSILTNIARHFYELGCRRTADKYDEIEYNKQRAEESGSSEIPNDLEEAAENHIREVVDAAGHPGWEWETRDIKDAFLAGAKWQAEQDQETIELAEDHAYFAGSVNEREKMLKEAVEVDVADLNGEIYNNCIEKGMTDENKVKIIIVKE